MTAPPPLPNGAVITEDGLWQQILRRPPAEPGLRSALFLDRDGVIVEEVGHLRRARDVRIIAGAAHVIAAANDRAIPVVIVSNQSGIGRGIFRWKDFVAVQERILADLAGRGASVDGVFACPHHPKARPPYRHADHPARKPNPGLLLRAAHALRIDLSSSWIVGDRTRDLVAGRNAGLAGGLRVRTGHRDTASERAALATMRQDRAFIVRTGASITDALTLPLFRNAAGQRLR